MSTPGTAGRRAERVQGPARPHGVVVVRHYCALMTERPRLSDADGLGVLLAALRAGASLVLVPDPTAVDLVQVARDEAVTSTYGLVVAGLPRLSSSAGPS